MDNSEIYAFIINNEWYYTGSYEDCVAVMQNNNMEYVYSCYIIPVEG